MKKEVVYDFLISGSNKSGYYSKESGFKKTFPEFYIDLMGWSFPDNFTFTQKLYHYFNDDPELKLGLCLTCGNRCRFKGFSSGYSSYCSAVCHNSNEIVKEKSKRTCLKNMVLKIIFRQKNVR